MKVLVCVKQTFDPEAAIKVAGGKVSGDGVALVLNPYDEIAVEGALRLKEAGQADEVVVVSAGGPKTVDAIRTALAMGADRAVFIAQDAEADEYARATALAEVIKEEAPGLVLAGHMAADDGSSQVPSRIAEILGWPNVNVITSLEVADGKATVTREADGGIETVEVPLPAVLSGQVTWYEAARYPTMKGIMQAKKKKVDNKEAAADNKAVVVSNETPAAKAPGQKVSGEPEEVAAQLADWMLNTVKVEVK